MVYTASLCAGTPEGRRKIVFWNLFTTGKSHEVLTELVRRFNESNGTYHVEQVDIPYGQLHTKMLPAIAGRVPPDVSILDRYRVASFAARGAFFALDAQEAEDALVAGPDTRSRYDELADQRDGSTTLAYTFYGLGAVAVAGGAVMAFVLDEPPSTPPTDSLSLVPTADGAALVLRTPF